MAVWLYPNVIKDYTFFIKVKLLSTVLFLSGKWCLAGGAPSMAEGLYLRGSLQCKGLFAETMYKWIKEVLMGARSWLSWQSGFDLIVGYFKPISH